MADGGYYFCLTHNAVEEGPGCRGADRMGPYSVCYDSKGRKKKHMDETLGHLNHVHLGLSLRGARMQTSFWR